MAFIVPLIFSLVFFSTVLPCNSVRVMGLGRCIDCVLAGQNWCESGDFQINGCWSGADSQVTVGCVGAGANQDPNEWVQAGNAIQCFADGVGCETDTCTECSGSDHVRAGCLWCVTGSLSQRCVFSPSTASCSLSLNGTCSLSCPQRGDCGSCLSSSLSSPQSCRWCAASASCNATSDPACDTASTTCPGFVQGNGGGLSTYVAPLGLLTFLISDLL